MKLKLYTAKLSPYAARCRMQVYAKRLDVEFVEYPADVSKQDILALSPIGKIPILTVGANVIPESEAICEYLEDLSDDLPLRPVDSVARARMRLLTRIADLYVFAPLSPLFAHLSRRHREQAIVDAGLAQLDKGLRAAEHFIVADPWAAGSELSLADCSLVPILFFVETYLPYFDIEMPLRAFPRLRNYWESARSNEHAARVIDEIREGIAQRAAASAKR